MKVLFLLPKLDTPSARWRVLQLVPHLKRSGISCSVTELPAGMIGKLSAVRQAVDFDVVFLQKKLLPKLLHGRLRKCAKRLVFEFDDSVTLNRTTEGVRASPTKERRFRRICESADAVVSANEYFAEQARRMGASPDRVHVLPSAIDMERWPARSREPGEAAPPVIGWCGSAGNLPYLDIVRQPLARLCRRHDGLVVRVVCGQPVDLPGVRLEHRPFSTETEVEDLGRFDVAIAPQVEDVWTRGRVSTKVLAYFAAGVPTVASNVASHRQYVVDGENGFLAGTLTEWEMGLERLIADATLRERVGRAGRRTAEELFSIRAVVPRYVELFEKLRRS